MLKRYHLISGLFAWIREIKSLNCPEIESYFVKEKKILEFLENLLKYKILKCKS